MGFSNSKELSVPPSSTAAYLISKNCGPCRYLQKWQNLTNDKLESQRLLRGTFWLDETLHLRSAVESKGSPIKQTEWDTYFNWHAEAHQKFQSSKAASLKDSLKKADEK